MGRWETGKVLLATMVGTMDTNALVPVIALYARSLGADLLQVGIIVGLYSAVHAPANVLFGRLADRWGRRIPLSLGLLWDAVSLFLYSLAATPLALALVRVSHGLGGGMVGPSSMSLVADSAPPERKGRAMALYGMSIAVAVVIGFAIAGPVVARVGFEALFYVLTVGLVLGFVVSLFVREPARAWQASRLRARQLARYFRSADAVAGYGAIFSLYFVLGAFVALVPLHLADDLGYGPFQIGVAFTVFAVLSLLLHYPAGILSDRFGPALPALVGLTAVGVAMAVLPAARDLGSLMAVIALFGVGHGFVFPSSSALVTRRADPESMGVVTGLFYALLVTGVAVGAPVVAAVAGPTGYGLGIWASAWIALVGIGLLAPSLLRSPESAPPSKRLLALTPRYENDSQR